LDTSIGTVALYEVLLILGSQSKPLKVPSVPLVAWKT